METLKNHLTTLVETLPGDGDDFEAEIYNILRLADICLKSLIMASRVYAGHKMPALKDAMDRNCEEVKLLNISLAWHGRTNVDRIVWSQLDASIKK